MDIRDGVKRFIRGCEYEKAYYLMKETGKHDLVGELRGGLRTNLTPKNWELLKLSYDLTARECFDDFCIATEWYRERKFYLPRRKALLPVVNELQRLYDDELDILCISMPPGVGKTGLAIFYLCWLSGLNPKDGILTGSHNTSFVRDVYAECLREIGDEEYRWGEIFPEHRIVKTNAMDLKIDIDKPQRFSTLQFTSAGSGNAGKLRAIQLLYCDDLIEGIEEAMSIERLDKKWRLYTDDLRQRKQGDCKELHIATRWSVHDVIGRLEEQYGDNDRAKFISLPALDENGESNFDYGGSQGFTTQFYEDIKETMDDASFNALYLNKPIEREGILYEREELRRFYTLPDEEPDAIVGVCDTSSGAGDDTVLSVFYVYGSEHYLADVVCSNLLPEATENMCVEILNRHKVKICQFESNSAGGVFADNVQKRVDTHITKKWSQANKETKIIVNSAWVKNHCLFLDESKLKRGTMYKNFMDKMCTYTIMGRNRHDDVVDCLSQYAIFSEQTIGNVATIVRRPF